MTDKDKLEKLKKLADAMYYAAKYLTTDASRLHKAMDEYHKFIINEYHKEEPVSEDLIEELKKIVNIRECVSQGVPVIKIARHFANWQKDQMMKDAVDGTAQTYLPFESIRFIGKPLRELGLKTNNPVKVIIIKEN